MANYFYGINKGQNEYQAVVGTSTNSVDVELKVNGANVAAKQDIMSALKQLKNYVLRLPFTPL